MPRPRSRSRHRPPGPSGDDGTQPPQQGPPPPGRPPGYPDEGPRPSGQAPRGPFEPTDRPHGPFGPGGPPPGAAFGPADQPPPGSFGPAGQPRGPFDPAEQPPPGAFGPADQPPGSFGPADGPSGAFGAAEEPSYGEFEAEQQADEPAGRPRRSAKRGTKRGGQANAKASKRRSRHGPEAYEEHPDQQEPPQPSEPPRRSRGLDPAASFGSSPSDGPRATTTEGFEDELDRAFAGAQRSRLGGLVVGGVAVVLAVLLAIAVLFVWDPGGSHAAVTPSQSGTAPKGGGEQSPSAAPSTQPPTTPPYIPAKGNGKFTLAKGGDVTGQGNKVMRYKVAVEGGLKQDTGKFAEEVDGILGDPRGWTASGKWAFERVASGSYEFVVKLSSPGTTDKLCGAYGMDTEGEVNCRAGKQVVVNLKRWLLLTKFYKGKPHAYHALTINHEVGHRLGYGHMTCPGDGAPAPVMMQQIYGLEGCAANPWPYGENGEFIEGPAVPGQ